MNKINISLLLASVMIIKSWAASRDADWKKVDEAMQKGLPQTAIEALEPILQGALKDKAYGEAAKALARKIVLEGNIQGNKPEEKITRLEAELARAPKEILPLLRTIQANWYWHYFQNNRWRFMQRTATAQAPGQDFTTWDLPRLFAEIDRVFTQALASADQLQQIPVGTFDDLLQKGTLPDSYRPTLYDFIAQEALKFYTSGEQAGAKPEDAYELSADSPALDSSEKFMAWQQTLDAKQFPDSPVIKALNLYAALLVFHKNDPDPTAFLDVDLDRLVYAYNTAFGENKAARYKGALQAFVNQWADHEVSARALAQWARVIQGEGNWVEARQLAERGENAHRNSVGGRLCHNLIQEIEAKSARITTERVWYPFGSKTDRAEQNSSVTADLANARPMPPTKITVRYRNLTRVYFRAIAWDWSDFLSRRRSRPEYLNANERKELLAKAPALTWSADLPATTDFKERTAHLPAPDNLKLGFYFLIASHDPDFGERNNQVSFTDFWVSRLALVVRPVGERIEGFVLEAATGEPIPGAEVMGWYLDGSGNRVAEPKTATDVNGFFSIDRTQRRGLLLRARHEGQEIATQNEYWINPSTEPVARHQTVFFTDRALYRPGQTIQYKGIALLVDPAKNNYEVLPGRRIQVIFADTNNKEIARAERQANEFGSFSGSFTAPRDRLLGRMRIYVAGSESGETWINVEEYKRPKFQVTLEAPKTAPKLNERTALEGQAEAYTGAAVDGAKVQWRVVREVRWPVWWGWWGWRGSRPGSASQEIAHGTTTTGLDGRFKIEFLAKPDPQVLEKDEASFHFSIHADVTDSAGETRSAERGVNVGFTALQASINANEWLVEDQPVDLEIRTTTLDGEPQVAEGALKIYRLKAPATVQRPPFDSRGFGNEVEDEAGRPDRDMSNPNHWDLAEVIVEKGFTTDAEGKAKIQVPLGVGVYRALLETQDRFGKKVTARRPLQVLKPGDSKLALRIPHLLAAPQWEVEPGENFVALWGTGYDQGRAFIEIEHRHRMIERFWTRPGATQQQIKHAVTEAFRGGFTLHVTQVRENRAYLDSRRIDVPWSNQELEVRWEHFTSKLEPGQKETWSLVIQRPKQKPDRAGLEKAVAELVATLYDESLDQFLPLGWPNRWGFFYSDYSAIHSSFANQVKGFQHLKGSWASDYREVSLRYREFPADLVMNFWGYGAPGLPRLRGARARTMAVEDGVMAMRMPAPAAVPTAPMARAALAETAAEAPAEFGLKMAAGGGVSAQAQAEPPKRGSPAINLAQVTARKNLNETAFFFPQLTSDSNGVVRLTFTMPEALTTWRFLGFAHDRQCRSGLLEAHTVTAKDLMVQPNPPRFLREGDVIEFTVKISNQSAARQSGKARLTLNYALDDRPADQDLGNTKPEQDFDLPAKESRTLSWRLKVPDGCGFLTYKAVGATSRISDGEEGYLPVLSRRIFVTESLPLPIRGPATKTFEFTQLTKSGRSSTLRNVGLTVQMVSNPSWYAVMALPYLMEYPYECSEQIFNRFYANLLARHIANGDPKIRRIFDQWKATPALDSPLEKNADLKSVMLEETPWLRQAQQESQARKNVGVLFDDNRLNVETQKARQQLTELQLPDGAWPWFPGGQGNDYITLYITTGFGRLRHLGVDVAVTAALRSLNRLDQWMDAHYRRILTRPDPQAYVPSPTDALYLYGRSFFLKDQPVADNFKTAVEFFLAQARKHWLKTDCRQTQGHLALALKRWGGESNLAAARDILRSIKERSVTSEEMGRFWRETELSWWWYRAPIETQALMIEAFDEVMGDAQAVEECRVWLLKQKQTQDWKTTKATADAVYALLLRGQDLLASDQLVEVTVGGIKVTPDVTGAPPRDQTTPNPSSASSHQPEPGTGFYEHRFSATEVEPKLGEITVKKADAGVAWGSVHWQYLEDMTKITPYAGTPLRLKKSLYIKTNTAKGPVLEPVKGPRQVGDELVVRLELRVDRDMEYVHLKDQRGSGTEPVNVLSHYKYQDGLGYYESTRDTASHFFIDYLPKGTYVFEYSTRIQLRGEYQSGLAEIQCLYAPEFNSHSESFPLSVR